MDKMICGLCSIEVESKFLSSHLIINHGWKMVPHHTKPVKQPRVSAEACVCPICDVSIKDAKRLQKHLDKVHSKVKKSPPSANSPAKNSNISTISYHWAITQKLESKYSGIVDKFVAEKTLSEIEKEITLIVNGYDTAETSRKNLMSGRLILLSHAKKRIEAKKKANKNRKISGKGQASSGDIMDQYIGGKKIVVSGGLPSLGKR